MPTSITDMTANRLNGYEPQRSNNGKLHIVGLTGIGGSDDFDADTLVLSVQGFPTPKWNSTPIEMTYMNEKRKYAGMAAYDSMPVTYKDLVTVNVAGILYKWRCLANDPITGKIGNVADYKKNAGAYLFDGKGANMRLWRIYGIWPSAYDAGDVDQDDDNVMRVSVTFEIDKMVLDPSSSPGALVAWDATTYPHA